MRAAPFRLFSAVNAALIAAALALAACGSSGQTFTSPSPVSRCAVAFDTAATTLPSSGGSGSLTIKTERECQWTAQPEGAWLTITAGSSGQGEGSVQFNAAQNTDPVARNGAIMVNGLRAPITQAAAECQFQLGTTSQSFGQIGGTGAVDVQASSSLCSWTANSDVDWISITSGTSGRGSARVAFTVAPTTGPPRAGTLTVAGLRFNVSQAEGCTFAIAPTTFAVGAAGGSNVVAVTAGPGCPWTASSDVNWISITTASGTGNGTVGFTVAPTSGPARSGTLTVAGQIFTVTQSPGCSFDVAPQSVTIDPAGGARQVIVGAAAGCGWTATSNAAWITITSGASGSGSGTVTFTIAATDGPSRTGSLSVAGQTVTVVQGQGCSYALSPASQNVPSGGGTGSVAVTAGAGCAWNATSSATWLAITGGASGSGSGTVSFSAAATTGPSRSATISVAGQSVTVVQGEGCTVSLSPGTQNVSASGGTGNVSVTVAAGCAWNASSNASWLTITSGASGSGSGTIAFSAAATTGPSRTATITVNGKTATVVQAQGCSFDISPDSQSVGAGGGDVTVAVAAGGGCSWTARSNVNWISIDAGASGSGNGSVRLHVAATSGPARSGTATIAGRTFTLNQNSGCTLSLSSASATVPRDGGAGSFDVRAGDGCTWAASSNAAWLMMTGANGTGNGTVRYSAQANTGPQRVATITVGSQTFTVTQEGACTFSLNSTSQNVASSGGTLAVDVSAPGGCTWTAASNVGWVAVTNGASGSGNGSVQLTVAASSEGERRGTVTIANQTFTVVQASGCSVSLAPAGQAVAAAGGSGSFAVNTGPGCAWTVIPNAPWISLTSAPNGSGSGSVQFSVAANTGAARSGTIGVSGQTFTINQDAGCSPTVAPETIAAPAGGASQAVTVTTSPDCSWTAASNAPWIVVNGNPGGSGSGTVQLDIQANSGPARSGTATIATRTVTVNQDGGCTFSIAPLAQSMNANAGTGSVTVTTGASCAWTAMSNVTWIVVTAGATGTGPGAVQYTVEQNTTGAARVGTITIAGQTFSVNQSADTSGPGAAIRR